MPIAVVSYLYWIKSKQTGYTYSLNSILKYSKSSVFPNDTYKWQYYVNKVPIG